jgi:LAO/AO transport system ATPase
MPRSVRVLISKIGLDGHDRGAKLIVRNLRDAGMEVIYTGLWQTPASTVHAALQEDVDVLGVSLLSAAHMTVMPELIRQCREAGIGDMPVIVGGIIPEQDKPRLIEAGLSGVYNPGTPMATIIDELTRLAEQRRVARLADPRPLDLSRSGGVARAITFLVEGHAERVGRPPKPAGPTVCIGVTGAPGVGKSTVIGRMAQTLRERGRRVAVIAVDPSSPVTGGALLGDRLRMMKAEPDDGLFVRSLASGGQSGGISQHTGDIARLLSGCGFEVVLIETVGAGQNDVAVREVASQVLLVLMPGAGDAVQFEKAGVVEIASGFVVNKADLPGVDKTLRELRETLEDQRPIWKVSAVRGEGVGEVCDWIESLRG